MARRIADSYHAVIELSGNALVELRVRIILSGSGMT
jgi:hypothetical protein